MLVTQDKDDGTSLILFDRMLGSETRTWVQGRLKASVLSEMRCSVLSLVQVNRFSSIVLGGLVLLCATVARSEETSVELESIQVPEGFLIEQVAASPLVKYPMLGTLDDTGRLFVCESAGLNLDAEQLLEQLPNSVRMLEDTDGEKIAVVGITAFAVEQLVDVTYLEMQPVGTPASAGKEIGEIESVKAVSSLYSPVTGEVIESNEDLGDNLDWLSEEPFGKAWMIKVKVSAQGTDLMDGPAYDVHCKAEG